MCVCVCGWVVLRIFHVWAYRLPELRDDFHDGSNDGGEGLAWRCGCKRRRMNMMTMLMMMTMMMLVGVVSLKMMIR